MFAVWTLRARIRSMIKDQIQFGNWALEVLFPTQVVPNGPRRSESFWIAKSAGPPNRPNGSEMALLTAASHAGARQNPRGSTISPPPRLLTHYNRLPPALESCFSSAPHIFCQHPHKLFAGLFPHSAQSFRCAVFSLGSPSTTAR